MFGRRRPVMALQLVQTRCISQAIQAAAKRYRGVLSFESRFQVPEGGMKESQYLARGSAILLEKTNPQTGKCMAGIVTSRHIAHPFATPFYYEQAMSWLQEVKPHHCTFFASLVGVSGPVWEIELERDMLKSHPSLDVCLFQFPSSESRWFLDELEKLDSNSKSFLTPKPFSMNVDDFPKYANVDCVGFDYSQDTDQDRVDANRFMSVRGRIISAGLENGLRRKVETDGRELTMAQEFRVETETKLRFGMCGGPIVLGHDPTQLVGVIEGIDSVNGIVHCLPTTTLFDLFDDSL